VGFLEVPTEPVLKRVFITHKDYQWPPRAGCMCPTHTITLSVQWFLPAVRVGVFFGRYFRPKLRAGLQDTP
jgi:hypothetical protein